MKIIINVFLAAGLLAVAVVLHASCEGDVRFLVSPSCSPNGSTIIFATNAFNDDLDLWMVNINGTGLTRLTNTPNLDEDRPVYSPNGQYIAYQLFTHADPFVAGNQLYEIYVMNADGTDKRLFSSPKRPGYAAAWLNDNSRLVLETGLGCGTDILIRDLQGVDHEVVSASSNHEHDPHCSQDGTWVVYNQEPRDCEMCEEKGTICSQIWKRNISPMGNKIQLTTGHYKDTHPRISYDGTKITFTTDRNGEHTNSIYVMNADGTGLSRINTPSTACYPCWMPDGRILFVLSDADPNGASMYNIALINADGTGLTRVTQTVTSPTISPAEEVTFPVDVSITCSTPDAVIHYTTDGSDPTQNSPTYSGPIHLTQASTVSAKAWKQGWLPSLINTQEFQVEQ